MKPLRLLSLLIFLTSTAAQAACDLETGRRVLAKTKNLLTIEWTLSLDDAFKAADETGDPALTVYADWVRRNTALTEIQKLEIGCKLRRDFLDQAATSDGGRADMEREIWNLTQIIEGRLGRMREMACAESLPFRELLKFVDLRKKPAELHAVLLVKDRSLKIIADFDRLSHGSAQESERTIRERAELQKAGWSYAIHLHSHPFVFGNPYGDVGGNLAPSAPDIEVYQSQKPGRALITNGINSIELTQAEYMKFRRRP